MFKCALRCGGVFCLTGDVAEVSLARGSFWCCKQVDYQTHSSFRTCFIFGCSTSQTIDFLPNKSTIFAVVFSGLSTVP